MLSWLDTVMNFGMQNNYGRGHIYALYALAHCIHLTRFSVYIMCLTIGVPCHKFLYC